MEGGKKEIYFDWDRRAEEAAEEEIGVELDPVAKEGFVVVVEPLIWVRCWKYWVIITVKLNVLVLRTPHPFAYRTGLLFPCFPTVPILGMLRASYSPPPHQFQPINRNWPKKKQIIITIREILLNVLIDYIFLIIKFIY